MLPVEGDREKIDPTAERLGLAGVPTSTANYRALYDEYAARNGIERGDMTFAAEAASRA